MQHDDLLVGFDTGDDAAVYRLTDDLAVIQTVDFFPPIVDDPYDFGAIAVVNALSDVYAMGGVPLLALNIVCFPEDLPKEILGRILLGGMDAAREAGVVIAGGHTVKDREPKYGLAVTGVVHPNRIVTNAATAAGDNLVLTKPLGSGIITTAAKAGVTDDATLAGAVAAMRQLNRAASEVMQEAGVKAATDITGFGLIGHLLGMLRASGTGAALSMSSVPLLPGVRGPRRARDSRRDAEQPRRVRLGCRLGPRDYRRGQAHPLRRADVGRPAHRRAVRVDPRRARWARSARGYGSGDWPGSRPDGSGPRH